MGIGLRGSIRGLLSIVGALCVSHLGGGRGSGPPQEHSEGHLMVCV